MHGVLRTKVGYSGGSQDNPDYHDLKDHSETTMVQFDPEVITYKDLLKAFWANHEYATPIEKQYKSAIFYNDDSQKAQAEASVKEVEAGTLGNPAYQGKQLLTVIEKATPFYVAETYHQKYFLQCNLQLFKELQRQGVYQSIEDVIADRMSASLNGYLACHGDVEGFLAEVDSWPVSFKVKQSVFAIISDGKIANFVPYDDTAMENPLPEGWVGSDKSQRVAKDDDSPLALKVAKG